ncbi:MAG: hypothetical protein JXR84_28490 [Anaerolineae bacterium]|nr:hypothetical protein [Anaerolineae bacterium]
MTSYTLTVLDTPGIQRYIFGSNRLRENIGASELVHCATSQWPLERMVEEYDDPHGPGRKKLNTNVHKDVTDGLDPDKRIECDPTLDAEIIYIGGGNVVTLFREKQNALDFVARLHAQIIQEAPGLGLAAIHLSIEWEKDDLGQQVNAAMQQLAQQHRATPLTSPLLGLSVTAECQSTGLVATGDSTQHPHPPAERPYLISSEVAAKLEMVETAQTRLHHLFSDAFQNARYDFPRNFDELGRSKHEMSYIAVVHVDGNRMGRFFRDFGRLCPDPRAYIDAVRNASQQIKQASRSALQKLGNLLLATITHRGRDWYVQDNVPVRDWKLPFRPLVFGGDDTTFVCDGRLGLTLAVAYLEAFEDATQGLEIRQRYACAGIAVVKSHYPFARAYALSQELTKNAKKHAYATPVGDAEGLSALDWHFAMGGLSGSLSEIREREYRVASGTLVSRPLRLRDHANEWRTWPKFAKAVESFQQEWSEKRNKLVSFRQLLREGPEAMQSFLEAYRRSTPALDETTLDFLEHGWHGEICGYFDALEALDFYVALEG